VTLHRVGTDRAGPLDSLRTDARGGFAFHYKPSGSDDALYFASTRYGGVAYFTSPFRSVATRGEDAEITVFDTTSTRVPTTVRGRHLIVSAADVQGARNVIEVFEVSNDSSVTGVERGEGAAGAGTWSVAVPASATRLEVKQGEVPSDALAFAAGRAVLHMPLAPGIKQIAFSYAMPADAFPLTLRTEGRTTVLEVLIEDPHGTAAGPRLAAVDPVVVEGRSFRRYLAQDVPPNSQVVVDVPRAQPSWVRWIVPAVLGLLGVGMLSALVWPRRRRARATVVEPATGLPASPSSALADDAAQLAREIAALDDAFEREAEPTSATRAAYDERRGELKARLARALAREGAAR
jgi:hypothetical protein